MYSCTKSHISSNIVCLHRPTSSFNKPLDFLNGYWTGDGLKWSAIEMVSLKWLQVK